MTCNLNFLFSDEKIVYHSNLSSLFHPRFNLNSFFAVHLIFSCDSNITTSIVLPSIGMYVSTWLHITQFTFLTYLKNWLSNQSTLFISSSTYCDFQDFLSCFILYANAPPDSSMSNFFCIKIKNSTKCFGWDESVLEHKKCFIS